MLHWQEARNVEHSPDKRKATFGGEPTEVEGSQIWSRGVVEFQVQTHGAVGLGVKTLNGTGLQLMQKVPWDMIGDSADGRVVISFDFKTRVVTFTRIDPRGDITTSANPIGGSGPIRAFAFLRYPQASVELID